MVSPEICPGAFIQTSLAKALDSWDKNLIGGQLPAGYSMTDDGRVTLHGAFVHPDYDLMTIVNADSQGAMSYTPGSSQYGQSQFKRAKEIQWEINSDLGIDMIQHGPEFMWTGGIGAADFEFVLWFGPNGQFRRDPSSNQIRHKK